MTSGGARLRVVSNDDTDDTEVHRLLMPREDKVTFADVGGLDDIKSAIRKRIILPFQKPSLFERFKKRIGGGILLYGPPGCGKTLLARATAGECAARFFNVTISDILDMYIGESERKLHAVFETARQSKPSVLFFDELEALGVKRQYHREGSSSKLVSQFLSELDGFSRNNQGVLVLGATNVPWDIDPAFHRPGRFDRVLFVPPPDRGVSYDKIRLGFEQMLGFPVARSTLCRAMQRLARRAKPTRDALVEALRASPVVYADETGWKQGGRRVWLWVFTNLRETVYEILPGRGFEQAASVLGPPVSAFSVSCWMSARSGGISISRI